MTHDPKWLPREDYAEALMAIGTAAVPALCRILLDPTEIEAEGTWNAHLAARGLGVLGAAAAEGRRCLMQGLLRDYAEIGLGRSELIRLGGQEEREAVLSLQTEIATSLADIGDPERSLRDELLYGFQTAADLATRLIFGWTMGMTYGEMAPAIGIIPLALDGDDDTARIAALAVLAEFAEIDGFAAQAGHLEARVRALAASKDKDISSVAQHVLEALEAPAR